MDKRQSQDHTCCFQLRGLLLVGIGVGFFLLAAVFLGAVFLGAVFFILDLFALVGFLAVVIGRLC